MKSKTMRLITSLLVIVFISVGFVSTVGIGTVSAFGWGDISILCPLGALGTMLASKMMVPQALVSLVIDIILIVLLGRAFCAWVCPVPLLQKFKKLISRDSSKSAKNKLVEEAGAKKSEANTAESSQSGCSSCSSCKTTGCFSKKPAPLDSRHFILGGALLSTALFGFPVFCLVCPVGLSFATILLVIRLFGGGDVTWSLILIPVVLILEVLFFKKWCHKICPLSAFMSLVGKANRTFKPVIDDNKCIETSKAGVCGACAKACPEGIDPRHPERSQAAWSECTKCRACVDACPTHAITMPLLPSKDKVKAPSREKATDEA